MAMNFNLRKVVQEAAEADPEYCPTGSIDEVLGKSDLEKLFTNICPISGDVCKQMQEQAASPESLRIVFDEQDSQFYMDYNEMVNFCEATGLDVRDAADKIVEAYSAEFPMFTLESFNIVFPQLEAYVGALKGRVGYQDVAWSSHFLSNCINKGLKCVSFQDPGQPGPGENKPDPVTV